MDDLLKKVLGLGDNVKQFVTQAAANAGGAINQAASDVGSYFNPNSAGIKQSNGSFKNFWTDIPSVSPLTDFINSSKGVALPSWGDNGAVDNFAKTLRIDPTSYSSGVPEAKFAYNNLIKPFGDALSQVFINTPIDIGREASSVLYGQPLPKYETLKSAPVKIGYQLSDKFFGSQPDLAVKQSPQEFLGNVAGAVLPILTAWAPGGAGGLAREGVEKSVFQAIKEGAISGGSYGGIYGALSGLEEGKKKDLLGQFGQALLGGVGGAAVGSVFGAGTEGTVAGASKLISAMRNKVIGALKVTKPGMPEAELPQAADKFLRDELGRFAGLKVKFIKDPYITDSERVALRQELGLPTSGNYQGGFIRLPGNPKVDEILKEPDVAKLVDTAAKSKSYEDFLSKVQETLPLQPETLSKLEEAKLSLRDVWGLKTRKEIGQMPKPVVATPAPIEPAKPIVAGEQPFNPEQYVAEQVNKQTGAGGEAPNLFDPLKNIGNEIKRKFVDFTAPIEDRLSKAEKEGGFTVLPSQDVRYQIDKALRADSLATQFIKDNGLDKVIQGVDNLDGLNQYLIAKRALEVAKNGIETGRDLVKDQQLVSSLAGKYEPFAAQIRNYNQKLLDYKVSTGLIPKELGDALKRDYPDYVPLQRVFSAIEEEAMHPSSGKGGVASISVQNVLKKLKGSEREIKNPLESIVENTGIAFREGERNKAAQMLASYKDLPGNPFGLRLLDSGETAAGKHTISVFVDGKKAVFETLPEVAAAAKNLNSQQLNILGKILSVPTRLLQMGAVGLNLPFTVSNLVKDQVTANVISSKATKTSLVNPLNFVKAVYAALGHGKLYDDWVRSGASFTSFDIARDQVAPTIERLRANKDVGSKILYTAKNPLDLFRAVENVIGRGEEVTRLQQFNGTRDALIKEGRSAADAELMAAAASRNNTANFGRKGEWGTVLNGAIPFFNAGIQGARSLVRAFEKDPKGTTIRFATTVGLPTVGVTLWNLSDPNRAAAYADIPEYEKESNLIILPPNPQKDENGNWPAIKIPITPGISNLMSIIRRQVEGTNKLDAPGVGKIASDLFSAGTSIDPTHLLSTFVPQAIKPFVEDATNTNLFTGQKIVPEYMKSLPADQQVRESTSPVAKAVGGALGVSPFRVENFISTAFAGVGRQITGKASVPGEFNRRFFSARGGNQIDQIFNSIEQKVAGAKTTSGNVDQDLANYGKVLKFDEYLGKNPYSGIKAKAWENDKIDIARKAYGGDGNYSSMPDSVKEKLYEKFGLKQSDVSYDYSAGQKDDIKSDYLSSKMQEAGLSHKEAVAVLVAGRKESLGGKMLASDGVLDNLYESGVISKAERAALKKIKLNDQGAPKIGSGGSGGGSNTGGLTKSQYNSLLSQLKTATNSIQKAAANPPKISNFIENSKAAPASKPVKIPAFTVDPYAATKFKTLSVDDLLNNSRAQQTLAPKISVSGKLEPGGRGGSVGGLKLSQSFYRPRKQK